MDKIWRKMKEFKKNSYPNYFLKRLINKLDSWWFLQFDVVYYQLLPYKVCHFFFDTHYNRIKKITLTLKLKNEMTDLSPCLISTFKEYQWQNI